jgi:hypothetical protein
VSYSSATHRNAFEAAEGVFPKQLSFVDFLRSFLIRRSELLSTESDTVGEPKKWGMPIEKEALFLAKWG